MRATTLAVLAAGLLALSGCGIKGDLYIPQVPKPAPAAGEPETPAEPATQPAPGADDTKPAGPARS